MEVANQLSSEQREQGAPIDQITADKIARDVSGEIKETIVGDAAELLPLLTSSASLVQMGILQPADWMSCDDFKKAHGANAERMIEEHLAPNEEIKVNDKTTNDGKSTTTGDETTKREGGGFGFSLPFIGKSSNDEDVKRHLNFVADTTGVDLREGTTKGVYLPHRITAYKYAKGSESPQVSQTKVVAIGGEAGKHYLKDTPISQRITAELVARSLGDTSRESTYLGDLLQDRKRLEDKLRNTFEQVAKLESVRASNTKLMSELHQDVHKAHVDYRQLFNLDRTFDGLYQAWMCLKAFSWAQNRNWDHQWQEYIGAAEKHPIYAGNTRGEIRASAVRMYTELDQKILEKNGQFQQSLAAVESIDVELRKAADEVVDLRKQITRADERILAAARR